MAIDVRPVQPSRSRPPYLVGVLRRELDAVTDRVAGRAAALPTLRALPAVRLRADVRTCLDQLLAAEPGTPPGTGHGTVAAAWARRGVSAADLLLTWQAVGEELLRQARALPSAAAADAALLRLAEWLAAARDAAVLAAVDAHRTVEADLRRDRDHHRALLVRHLLTGAPAGAGLLDRFGLDPAGTYHAVRARAVDTGPAELERLLVDTHLPACPPGVVALVDGEVCGVVPRVPVGGLRLPLGVDGPVPLDGLPRAFRRAARALATAVRLGRGGPVDVAALGVDVAVTTDDDVGEALLDRYVRPLTRQGPAGEMILDTVARYLANDARLDTTARQLHVHVNTVRYRLGRFEQVTGGTLRRNDHLVEVWWALRRHALDRSR